MIKVIMGLKGSGKTKKLIDDFNLTCYAFDIAIKDHGDEMLYDVLLRSWHKLMISKFKRDYCDGLSKYILAWRVRNGEKFAEISSKALREVMIEKYSIEKEETNQP